MNQFRELDIDNIARIGLLFLDSDKFEEVLLDKTFGDYDEVNYNHEYFNILKIALLKIEKINPDVSVVTILWQKHKDNEALVIPVILSSQPCFGSWEEEWCVQIMNDEMKAAFNLSKQQSKTRNNGFKSNYYPMKNSNDEIVGVLEIQLKGVK